MVGARHRFTDAAPRAAIDAGLFRAGQALGSPISGMPEISLRGRIVVTGPAEVIIVIGREALGRIGAEVIRGRREAFEACVIAELLDMAQTDGQTLANIV